MSRIDLRDAFQRLPRQLHVTFFTSSRAKFAQASTIFQLSGARLAYRAHEEDPYHEEYGEDKKFLLTQAIGELRHREGYASFFFIEDTSIKIEALSSSEDFPGLRAKEWFAEASFADTLRSADVARTRRVSVESRIALTVPGLDRVLFFSGETHGNLVSELPVAQANLVTPWLDPSSFSGWFVPDGATRTLGEMSLEESFSYDFRAKSLLALIDRLEELTLALNAGTGSYRRLGGGIGADPRTVQPALFDLPPDGSQQRRNVFLVVGPTCSGKTTFGVQVNSDLECDFVDASSLIRQRMDSDTQLAPMGDFASNLLERQGFDLVARDISSRYSLDGRTLIVTGLRTIEEIEHLRELWPDLVLVSLRTPQRVRYKRYVDRASRDDLTFSQFQQRDAQQAELGLLPVADELANIIVDNVLTQEEFVHQIRGVLGVMGGGLRGVTRVASRTAPKHSQLFRSLVVLRNAGRALTTQEVSAHLQGKILPNNVNKMLRRHNSLALRRESPGSNVRYEITAHGLAYLSALERLDSLNQKTG